MYVAFTLTHETLWNSLSEAKVSVNLRKVSWLGLLLVGGRTIREGGPTLCRSWAPFNQRGAAAVTTNPPGTMNIPELKFCSQIFFWGRRLISHQLSDRIRRHLLMYYWKVIWNLLEIQYWLVSSLTSSQFRTRAMSENLGHMVVPQLLFFHFCHFVALGKCEYLLHVQRIAIHLNCTSQLGDCLNSHEIHENYFSPPCIHSLHPRVAPAEIHWDPLVSAGYPPQNKGRGNLALTK